MTSKLKREKTRHYPKPRARSYSGKQEPVGEDMSTLKPPGLGFEGYITKQGVEMSVMPLVGNAAM